MIRRPPRSTLDRSSAASDVYKRQVEVPEGEAYKTLGTVVSLYDDFVEAGLDRRSPVTVSYTHLRAHETVLDLVCRLLLEKKKKALENNGAQVNICSDSHEPTTHLYVIPSKTTHHHRDSQC